MKRIPCQRALPLFLACFVLGSAASGQSLNVDVSDLTGVPSSSYGAGAAQPGFWNPVDGGSIGTVFALKDLSGAATGASVSYQLFGNGVGNFSFDNTATTGDDEALLDDLQDIGSGTSLATWTISGLNPGTYQVYTYSWAPDEPLNSTSRVRVLNSPDPEQGLGGNWTGSHVLGVTYAKHSISVAAGGQVVIEIQPTTPSSGFASINGVQLVEGGSAGKFCTSRPSSLPNCTPSLNGSGLTVSKTAGTGSYDVTAGPVPGGGNPGILIYSKFAPVGPITSPFGPLCLANFLRAGAFPDLPGGTIGVCDGAYLWDFGNIAAVLGQISVGDSLHLQAWYRDPANSGGANFTEGVGAITVGP